jgi:SNF2 family DNA or RNA helicase
MKIVAEKTKFHRFALYYDYTPDRVEFCRSLKESFGWDKFSFDVQGELKRWIFSDSLFIPVIVERFPEVQIDPDVESIVSQEQRWANEQKEKNKKIDEIRTKKDTNFKVSGLKKDLYSYQKVGVEFLLASGGRAIVADAPGLGKTAEALAYIKHMDFRRVLVVCPASVKFAWANEIVKWTRLSSVVINSKTDLASINPDINFWIINYDILKSITAN